MNEEALWRKIHELEKIIKDLQLRELPQRQAAIVNADGTLADLTTKFNTLLTELETMGLLTP